MIVFNDPEPIRKFIYSYSLWAPTEAQYIGWEKDGQIVAAACYYKHNARSVEVTLAMSLNAIPRKFLFAILWYPFVQLKVKRLTLFVSASNLKSINFITKLGAHREATLQDGSPDGDAYIYCLRPEGCPIWRKLWAVS